MRCSFCAAPDAGEVFVREGGNAVGWYCGQPTCVQAAREERWRAQHPHQAVRYCLPGMHEPYGSPPPGQPPRCRHCPYVFPPDAAAMPPAGEKEA